MYPRCIQIPKIIDESFFLWGPRQTGKSTLLTSQYPTAHRIDLLLADQFRQYATRPETLREEVLAKKFPAVIIDEIQKVPSLLDEVHWLIENTKTCFALCGSSARKVKRGHANLLGGRALRFELGGLVSEEIGADFNLDAALNDGYLPRHYGNSRASARLDAYISEYLKEEIAEEGLVRNLESFSKFLELAALSDAEQVNFSTFGRDTGVSGQTIKGYFDILCDTLLGTWLPAFRKRPKRKISVSPKFFFFDVGIVNILARRKRLESGSALYGKAFENWVFHEVSTYLKYQRKNLELSFWSLTSDAEVDFILGDMEIAIEAKATPSVHGDHLKGLRSLVNDHPEVKKRMRLPRH